MKESSTVNEPIEITEQSARASTPKRSIIAPWWNTILLIILIAATSLVGSIHASRGSMTGHHLANYAVTIGWEWALAALALWGSRLKNTPLRELLGERRLGLHELLADVAAAAAFWIFSAIVLASLALLLRLFHLESAQKQISQLAPSSIAEAALWIALSVTAGICEEFIFRGYLQQQFTRATGKAWVGVLLSALLFGAAHGYEGIAGMLMITVYGALFSLLAIRRKSLRAGMIAHSWHDSVTGMALWFLNRAHVPLGIV